MFNFGLITFKKFEYSSLTSYWKTQMNFLANTEL